MSPVRFGRKLIRKGMLLMAARSRQQATSNPEFPLNYKITQT